MEPNEDAPTTDFYQDISQVEGMDQSLVSIASSSSSDGGIDMKPQIREQFDRE